MMAALRVGRACLQTAAVMGLAKAEELEKGSWETKWRGPLKKEARVSCCLRISLGFLRMGVEEKRCWEPVMKRREKPAERTS